MSYLDIQALVAGYGSATVLRDVNCSVDEGESVALIGRNGAGKSTLLLSPFGGTRIRSGTIRVDGVTTRDLPAFHTAKLGISLSPQSRMILPNLTIEENLRLAQACGRRGEWSLDAVYQLFPVLRERAHTPGTSLSGGQQQMLAIGRALMCNPRVLLLDEPSEGLSPVLVDELADVLNRIRRTGTGILLAEQHLNLVRRVADRFIVLSKGRVVLNAPVEEIDHDIHQKAISL